MIAQWYLWVCFWVQISWATKNDCSGGLNDHLCNIYAHHIYLTPTRVGWTLAKQCTALPDFMSTKRSHHAASPTAACNIRSSVCTYLFILNIWIIYSISTILIILWSNMNAFGKGEENKLFHLLLNIIGVGSTFGVRFY